MKKPDSALIIVIIVLSLAYLTMLIGIGIEDSRDEFITCIPLLYIITIIALLFFHRGWTISFLLFLVLALVGIFLIQIANVKTGWFYGQIKYGTILGPKIFGVPIAPTFNRFVLLYCAGMLTEQLKLKNVIFSSLIAALILLLINLIAEPVATSLKFWAWATNMSPFHNFGVRFIVSFIFLYFFYTIKFTKKNKIYLPIFIMEVIFFLILNLEIS